MFGMFRHILAPVDLAPADGESSTVPAVHAAIELAKLENAKLTLLHVHEPQPYFYPAAFPVPTGDLDQAVRQASQVALDAELERVRKEVPSAEALHRPGAPWSTIVETAQEIGADLIVVSTHGRRGIPRALLGSVAEKVVRMSTVPVLTVHRGEPAKETAK